MLQKNVKAFLEREYQEEMKLVTTFEEIQEKTGTFWVFPMCQKLNWDYEKVQEVHNRLKKKGIKLVAPSIEIQLLKLLEKNGEATAGELGKNLDVGVPWIACLLKKLLEQKVLTMKKDGRKKIYKLKTKKKS